MGAMIAQKSRICFVLPCNIFVAPFYRRYENISKRSGVLFDLIIWDRLGVNEESSANNVYVFSKKDTGNNGNPLKIYKFILFNRFVKSIIERNNYSRVVFLGSFAANGLPIWRYLAKHYPQKYWYDIRDYTYEWFFPYYRILTKVLNNASVVAISSPGYRAFLPNRDYVIAHNIDYQNISGEVFSPNKINSPVRISFIGNIRYFNQNIELINVFGNDDRFLLQYFGAGSEKLKTFAQEKSIRNVKFYGRFDSDLTKSLYQNTDIINNVYGNDSIAKRTALSNKLYFSLALRMPILISDNTFMQEVLDGLGLAYVVSNTERLDPLLPDRVFQWYSTLNVDVQAISQTWEQIIQEDNLFESRLMDFFKEAEE